MSRCDGLANVLMDRPYTVTAELLVNSIMSRTERKDVVDKDDRTQIVTLYHMNEMESENQKEMAEWTITENEWNRHIFRLFRIEEDQF